MRVRSILIVMILTLASQVVVHTYAKAVVSGEYVIDPTVEAPWVVSVWVDTQDGADAEPEFICSASLYKPQFILTAAHCFQGIKGVFYVEVGASQLGKGKLVPIDSYWISPRYSKLSIVNDIAIAHLIVPVNISKYPTLDSSSKTGKSGTTSTVLGWGADQNGEITGDLRKSILKFDAMTASSKFGSGFNTKTNLAAGRFIAKEKIYTAACNGDSGGPLISGSLSKPKVVGVVSYGPAESCNLKIPTIFSRVYYYLSDIKVGENYTVSRANTNSLAVPYNLTAPTIQGDAVENTNVTCSQGSWTPNVLKFEFSWYLQESNGRFTEIIGANSESLSLKRSYFSKTLWCIVTASSNNGSREEFAEIKLVDLPEEIKFVAPLAGSTIAGKVLISTRAISATNVNNKFAEQCLVYEGPDKNSKKLCEYTSNSGDEEWAFDTTNWANGSYTFTFYAIDSSGRQSNTATRALTVSNASPVAAFVEPAEAASLSGEFTLKATAKPSSAGTATISKLCLKINGAKPTSGSYIYGSYSYTLTGNTDSNGCFTDSDQSPEWAFDTTNWAKGSYTFTFYAIDSSGRQSNTATRVFNR